ncbi:ribbon-helix-helix protein, CopG family [Rhodohalobacter sp. SW132]|uniref:ribbon-helix-helix domain-containing protein n=1 Tax=Rhodohalobacter sp. SW132 TaxID=2293433 RepID=UPI000E24ED6F|nr:ribbon-helix-helix domain-containing protein [Rhodohalobacter sp. SW132]REL24931.1 ribbon-helix-helix protein, CopG family [Rhodohalobacter sp. SW132]
MKSVRLPKELEDQLEALSSKTDKSHSVIIREALVEYIAKEKNFSKPYETGKEFFGKHGSGDRDRSVTYKSRIKEKIRDKHSD